MRTTTLLSACAFAALLALPAVSFADDFAPELRLTGAGASLRNVDENYGWVSQGRSAARLELGLGATIAPGLTVLGEYSTGGSERFVLGGYHNDFRVQSGGVRVRYAFDFVPYVRPYLTVGAGVVLGRDKLSTPTTTLEDRAIAFGFDGAAGIEVQSPGRFSIGFYNDYGYAYRTPLEFDRAETRAREGEPDASIDLGAIEMRGFQWRLGIFVAARF